jgi:hypothetical protein
MYQWVRPGFVQNGDNFYLNMDALTSAFAQQLSSTSELAAVSPIRAIGISTQTDGQATVGPKSRCLSRRGDIERSLELVNGHGGALPWPLVLEHHVGETGRTST